MRASVDGRVAQLQRKRLRAEKRQHLGSRQVEGAAFVILAILCVAIDVVTGTENTSGGSRVFNGVDASFRVINTNIRRDEPLKVALTLKNISSKSLAFRFTGPLMAGIYVYDSGRNRLSLRSGAALGEYPAADIKLKPGETFNTVLSGTPGDYYDLKPGQYYLRFIYDLRGISDEHLARQYMSKYRSQDVVLWDTRWYPFSVVN